MKQSIDQIRDKFNKNCLTHGKLRKKGCGIKLTDISPKRFTVDFDNCNSPLSKKQIRCDYLLIANCDRDLILVAPIELKSGRFHTKKVISQLRAGSQIAEQHISKNEHVKFIPILVSGTRTRKQVQQLKEIKNYINFHKDSQPIKVMNCNDKLTNALR